VSGRFAAPSRWRVVWSFNCQSFARYGGGNFKLHGAGDFWWGVAGGVVVQVGLGRGLPVGRPVALVAAMVALVLTAAMDLHGVAMVAGIVIAAVIG
jgi:hypothetical protein